MQFQNFREFYSFYLSEHSDINCKRLHFFGNVFVIIAFLIFLLTLSIWALIAIPILGYGCAWIGHYFFEKNKPATFRHPFYSFIADWVMFKEVLQGKIKLF